MDLVYPVRFGNLNEELRYSLRSQEKNLPHEEVHIVGYSPGWLTGVNSFSYLHGASKFENTTNAVRAACNSVAVSEDFILCNDDFFTLKPLADLPKLNRGPIDRFLDKFGVPATRDLLIKMGCTDILSYELHVPMIVNKTLMKDVLDYAERFQIRGLNKRTLYGNLAQYGGEEVEDCKVYQQKQAWDKENTFISTSDESFGKCPVGQWIRDQFPDRSRYELR